MPLKDPEAKRHYDAKWWAENHKKPAYKARSLAATARYRERHSERIKARYRAAFARFKACYPEKVKARMAVTNAIAAGRLHRQPCEVCGAVLVEAHHDDYAKPLEVRWLCRSHHIEADQIRRKENA